MNKRPILIFLAVFVAFGLAIPFWAISKEGSGSASPQAVAPGDESARELFITSCGACHTLEAAGTDGVVGPDLDDLLAQGTPESNLTRVESAILNGVQGRMPAGILQGENATAVAEYVATVAGQ